MGRNRTQDHRIYIFNNNVIFNNEDLNKLSSNILSTYHFSSTSIILIDFFFSLTLFLFIHRNDTLRHSVLKSPYFPLKSGGIEWRNTSAKKMEMFNISFPRVEIEPTTSRVDSYTLCPCATTLIILIDTNKYLLGIYLYTCQNQDHN